LLRYFRINDPYRLIGLLILMLIVYLPLFLNIPGMTIPELKSLVIGDKLNENVGMYTGLFDGTAPLAAWSFEALDSIFGSSLLARHICAFILIFLQAAFLGIVFISRKVFNDNTYIPSFIFFLLFLVSFDTLVLSGELIGFTFLLFALHNLFQEIEFRVQRDETVFNLGLFISIASLFSFSYAIFLFFALFVLAFFTRSTPRKFMLLSVGFLLPHLLVMSIAYLTGSLGKMWECYYITNLKFGRTSFVSFKTLFVLGIIPVIYFVVSLVMLQREARFSKYQSQVLQVFLLWMGFSLLYIFLCKDLKPQNMIVFIPALSFLFSHFLLFIRRKRFAEINTLILFFGIITVSYLSRFEKISSADYSKLMTKNNTDLKDKRVMVLEDSPEYFLNNKLAGPYIDWKIAEPIFRAPEYYENITEVYHFINQDIPDVIIDKENLMKPFLDRMPEIKKKFERNGDLYVKK
jgi:hypothetical protein